MKKKRLGKYGILEHSTTKMQNLIEFMLTNMGAAPRTRLTIVIILVQLEDLRCYWNALLVLTLSCL